MSDCRMERALYEAMILAWIEEREGSLGKRNNGK
jgi:hypothetical protein